MYKRRQPQIFVQQTRRTGAFLLAMQQSAAVEEQVEWKQHKIALMADLTPPSPSQDPSNGNQATGMFAEPPRERSFPTTAIAIASVAILILVAVLVLLGRRHSPSVDPNVPQQAAAYAPNLALSNIQMSESASLSGGKSTYIDGHIANHGTSTVTGITAQVAFPADGGPPQFMMVPLDLIRTREPYVDTEPVSAAPIAPNGEADFRLIFEGVSQNWNQQQPEIKIVRVSTK
jgi:hypothetical protein